MFIGVDLAHEETEKQKELKQMNNTVKIKQLLPEEELLCQLAEECGELAQAALKYRRAMTGVNPTPVTPEEARRKLVEEAADVYCCLNLLLDGMDHMDIWNITKRKKERWVGRLEARDAEV